MCTVVHYYSLYYRPIEWPLTAFTNITLNTTVNDSFSYVVQMQKKRFQVVHQTVIFLISLHHNYAFLMLEKKEYGTS